MYQLAFRSFPAPVDGIPLVSSPVVSLVPQSLSSHNQAARWVAEYDSLLLAYQNIEAQSHLKANPVRDSLRLVLFSYMKPLLAAALSGNSRAKGDFEVYAEKVPLDGHYSEEYNELYYFYRHGIR